MGKKYVALLRERGMMVSAQHGGHGFIPMGIQVDVGVGIISHHV